MTELHLKDEGKVELSDGADDGSTLISLQTSSSRSPSIGGLLSECNPRDAKELLHSVPSSFISEISSIGDDAEQVGPQEHPVPNVADGPVSSEVSLPKSNYVVDTETRDLITEGEMEHPVPNGADGPVSSGVPIPKSNYGVDTETRDAITEGEMEHPVPNNGPVSSDVAFPKPNYGVDIETRDVITEYEMEHPVPNVADGPVPSDVPLPKHNYGVDTETGDVITEKEMEHPVPNLADGPVSSAVPLPKHNYGVDTETGDVIPGDEMTLLSGFSSSPLKWSSSGTLTSYSELAHSIASFPSRLSLEGLSAGHRPGGQEPAAVDANTTASMDGKETSIAVQFASPEVVAGQDDVMVDTTERTSSGEGLGYEYSSPITYESGVEFGSTPVVRDHGVALDRSSSWEWPPAFAEGEVASPAAFPDDDVLNAEEKMAIEFPSPENVLTNDDPMVVKDAMATELSGPSVASNDDVVVIQHTMAVPTNDDPMAVKDTMATELSGPAVVSNDDVVVVQHTMPVEHVSPASFGGDEIVVVEDDTMATEVSSPASFLDDNSVLVQDTGAVELVSSAVVRDDDAVPEDDSMTVEFLSPAVVPHDDSVGLLDEMAVKPASPDVVGDEGVVMEEAMAVKAASPPRDKQVALVQDTMSVVIASPVAVVTDDDVVVEQEQDSSKFAKSGAVPSPPISSGMGGEVASPAVVSDSIAVNHERSSSSYAGPGNSSSSTHILVHKEGYHCRETDSSFVEHSASVPSPVLSEAPVAEEQEVQVLDAAVASEALEVVSPRQSPGSARLSPVDGSEDVSTFHASEKADQAEDCTLDEQQPAKRAKTSGAIYSGADAVAVVLGQTAEIVLILAGMAQMRAGRMPTSYERELAATAYQNLGILVSQVAPNNLVAKESLERMLQEYNMKKVAQKKREDQAWVEALTEAEALANVRAETLARAKAEAAARAQAELAARPQAEAAAARAQAEAEAAARAQAESEERRQQAAVKAAVTAANDPSKDVFSSPLEGSRLTSDQSAYGVSELAQSASLPTPAVHPNSQTEIDPHVLSPGSRAGEIPHLVTQTEKSMSVNGHSPASKPTLRRPPKVRSKIRKEPATVTLFTPEYLNVVQGQATDPQKAHVTHKQLCLGVQQFIREHVPPVSQTLQALPPTYISTPIPCQVCKLIAKDTGSVLVCDSCDEVSHVKCVQPPSSRGASKGDWNCPKCLTASRGGKCPSKYGPIRHGSPNSVKLWPPHDISQGNPEPICSISNGSVRGEGKSGKAGRQVGSGPLIVQGKASLEIDTRAHQSMDDPSAGNVGSSPHLIVHLVNQPSPRTNHPLHSSPHSLLREDNQRLFPSGKSVSLLVHETSSPKVLMKNVATGDRTHLQGKTGTTMSGQNDSLKIAEDDGRFGKGLEKSDSRSIAVVVEDTGHETKHRRVTPAHMKKTDTRTQAIHSKKGNVDSVTVSQGKQAEVPLPIVMEWVGESIRKAEGKIYYRACSVGGLTFTVSDCALFRPETPDVPPYIARLQVLWEDIATGHKWVRVSWCYYPTDIPLAMGRPGTTAPDEVYESNHCDNNLVGSIQGPCFVYPPLKFIEETERRRTLKQRGDPVEELPPIFLSRWMYDAPKGIFRPLQE